MEGFLLKKRFFCVKIVFHMKQISPFSDFQIEEDAAREIYFTSKKGAKTPSYLESNALKLERFKEIVLHYIPSFNKDSLQFIVSYLKKLEAKIRIVLVRSPGGPNKHCMLFGQSKEAGVDQYFRVGIEPGSVRYPNGRMYVESVESGERTFFSPTDKKAFDLAMRRFYKAMVAEHKKPKKVSQRKTKVQPIPAKEEKSFDYHPYLQKLKSALKTGFSYTKKYGHQAWNTSRHIFAQAKDHLKKYQKTTS